MRAFWLAVMLGAVAAPTSAQSLEVFGYAGVLGEWELTATVTENASRRTKDGGDLHMRDDHADQRGDAGEVGDEVEDVDDQRELLVGDRRGCD